MRLQTSIHEIRGERKQLTDPVVEATTNITGIADTAGVAVPDVTTQITAATYGSRLQLSP